MSIKTEMTALVEAVASLAPHVRDTGTTQYGAALHQAEMVLGMADAELSPPAAPTDAMTTAALNALANLPPDTAVAVVVDTILRAALQAAREA